MRKSQRLLLSATLIVGLTCGVSSAGGFDEVPTSKTQHRHQYRGFSVEPPTRKGWTVRIPEQSPVQAIYRFGPLSTTHSLFASASLVPIDTTVPVEEALVPKGIRNPDRTEMLEQLNEADSSRKTPCMRFSIRYNDKNPPNFPDTTLVVIDRGIVCRHPTMPGFAVRAEVSERGLDSELDNALWEDFEPFLKNLHIESAPGVPAA